jgi:hypothetical protein
MNASLSLPVGLLGVGFLVLALAAAFGAARVRAPLAMALCVSVSGMAVGGAAAAFGAPGAGLVAAIGLGGVGPLMGLAMIGLAPGAARTRADGPPLASVVVALGLALALVWAGHSAPPLHAPVSAAPSPALNDRLISLSLGCLAIAALGALALLGFGERAESLRQPRQRRLRRHRLPNGEGDA